MSLPWKNLDSIEKLDALTEESFSVPVVIYKHSTRCSISAMAKRELERSYQPVNGNFYYLDLLSHRDISNAVAEKFGVPHESPQVLVIRNGKSVYDNSHEGILFSEVEDHLSN